MAGKIYVAKVDGIADYEGRQIPIKAGVTRVREGHPLLEGRESVFEEITVQYDVETARQAPKAEAKPEPEVEEPKAEAPAKPEPKAEAETPTKPGPKPATARPTRGPRKSGS